MIVGESFLWLHLPKTGGTSLAGLFRELALPGVVVDPYEPLMHDSVELRERRGLWRAGNRRRFITARRLEQWLVSDWEHKRRRMNCPHLDFAPVRSGLFYSFRLGGTWVAADWWLQYFQVDEHVTALRLEHLQHDLNQHLLPVLPRGTVPFDHLPQANRKTDATAEPVFTEHDQARIAAVNPRWSAWQSQLYGE